MLADVLSALACPVCGGELHAEPGTLRCAAGHSFDVAREGYVNLLPGRAEASTADTPAMVAARRAFLEAGHFAPVYDAVLATVRATLRADTTGVFLDAGAGTGQLLATLLDAEPARVGIALDISKHAARVAARSHARLGAIVADAWAPLPVVTASAALVTCVFSPRNASEFARVLAPGGVLVVVTPTAVHLGELVGPLGLLAVDPRKSERLSAKLAPHFEAATTRTVEYTVTLSRAEALAAAAMGPSAAHVSVGELEARTQTLPEPVEVTVSVDVAAYVAIASTPSAP